MTLDDRDTTGTFYNEIKFSSTDDAKTIFDRWFEWKDTSDNKRIYIYSGSTLYNEGDVVLQNPVARNVSFPAYVPGIDLFGNCDFQAKAVFGVENEIVCRYKITDLNECTSILSPNKYAGFEFCSTQS